MLLLVIWSYPSASHARTTAVCVSVSFIPVSPFDSDPVWRLRINHKSRYFKLPQTMEIKTLHVEKWVIWVCKTKHALANNSNKWLSYGRETARPDAILTGWVTLRLNCGLKGYVSRHYLWTIRSENCYTTTLPLESITQRNFVADFIQSKLNFIKKKQKNRFLSHPWGT